MHKINVHCELKNFKGSILYLEKEITLLENEQQKDLAKRDELLKNFLIKQNEDGEQISVHRLLQKELSEYFKNSEKKKNIHKLCKTLTRLSFLPEIIVIIILRNRLNLAASES